MTSLNSKTCVTCFKKVNRPSAMLMNSSSSTTIHQFESVLEHLVSVSEPCSNLSPETLQLCKTGVRDIVDTLRLTMTQPAGRGSPRKPDHWMVGVIAARTSRILPVRSKDTQHSCSQVDHLKQADSPRHGGAPSMPMDLLCMRLRIRCQGSNIVMILARGSPRQSWATVFGFDRCDGAKRWIVPGGSARHRRMPGAKDITLSETPH